MYPIGRYTTKGTELKLRLVSRLYLGLTALFYGFVGVAFASDVLRLTGPFQPHLFWSSAFILAGVLSAAGWLTPSYQSARYALSICSAVSLGFSLLFLSHLAQGDPRFLFGTVLWLYMAYTHFLVARLPDPYLLALLNHEVEILRTRRSGSDGG